MRALSFLLIPALAFADFSVPERKFVEKAAACHLAEIQLGRLALEKSQTPEVRNQAQSQVDQNRLSLDKLQSVARDQKFPLPTNLGADAQKDYDRLAKLEGDRFDHEYLELIHRRQAEAKDSYSKAQLQNPDLRTYVGDTLKKL